MKETFYVLYVKPYNMTWVIWAERTSWHLGETTLLLLGWQQDFQVSYEIFGSCFRKLVLLRTFVHNMTSRPMTFKSKRIGVMTSWFRKLVQALVTCANWTVHHSCIVGWLGWAMVLGSFQCRGVLLLLHIVGQGSAVLAAGAGSVGYIFFFYFSSICLF